MGAMDKVREAAPDAVLTGEMLLPGPELAARRILRGLPSDPLLLRLFEAHGRMHDGRPLDAPEQARILRILGPSAPVDRAAGLAARRERARVVAEMLRPRALAVVAAVARAERVPVDDLLSRRPRYRISRDLAIWAVSRMEPGLEPCEVGTLFGGLGPSGVAAAIARHLERASLCGDAP